MDKRSEKRKRIVSLDPFDHLELRKQIATQRQHAWDIDRDIDWSLETDSSRFFLPLDEDAIAFPGASAEQALVLSQYMGLVVNACIAEMECVASKLRDVAWHQVLLNYPVNPEMFELGELFFAEEAKHSLLFKRFNDCFARNLGIDPADLDRTLPKAYGSNFQRAIKKNAEAGGHAFWWVVCLVEEVSVLIYQQLYRHRREVDPLFYQVHRRHFEEESRHTSYAFMMLELIKKRPRSLKNKIKSRLDLAYSEVFSTAWVLAELHKVHVATELARKHEFFSVLASCLPLLAKLSPLQLASHLFVSAPYISLVLNRNYHKLTAATAKEHGAWHFMYPKPVGAKTFADPGDIWQVDAGEIWKVS